MSMDPDPAPTVTVDEFHYDVQPHGSLALSHDEVHVWHQDLSVGAAFLHEFSHLLSPDEAQRSSRFHFDHDRNEYIVARGTLRVLLGSYLNVRPEELRFAYSEFGRPSLREVDSATMLDFNVSHSGGMALLAFALERKIGIDVEKVRRDFGTTEIAERFFSVVERAALRELPSEQRHDAFFRCWTRKEAFIKALGEGLSHPLDQFDVSLAPGSPAALLATRPDEQEAKRWVLWNIQAPPGYAAALAAELKSNSE
jgi:4'-phosphopantetheinyl transferase